MDESRWNKQTYNVSLCETYRFSFLLENQYVTELSSSIGNDLGTTLVPHSYSFCFALKERCRGCKGNINS